MDTEKRELFKRTAAWVRRNCNSGQAHSCGGAKIHELAIRRERTSTNLGNAPIRRVPVSRVTVRCEIVASRNRGLPAYDRPATTFLRLCWTSCSPVSR